MEHPDWEFCPILMGSVSDNSELFAIVTVEIERPQIDPRHRPE